MITIDTPVRVRTDKGIPVEYRGHSGVVVRTDGGHGYPIIVAFNYNEIEDVECCGFKADELVIL